MYAVLWFILILYRTTLVYAWTEDALPVNTIFTFSSSERARFLLPPSPQLSVSFALCSQLDLNHFPQLYVVNHGIGNTDDREILAEIMFNTEGHGTWMGPMPNGGSLLVENTEQMSLQIGISDGGQYHAIS